MSPKPQVPLLQPQLLRMDHGEGDVKSFTDGGEKRFHWRRLFCLLVQSSRSPEGGEELGCLWGTEAASYLLVATCLHEIAASLTRVLSRVKLHRRCGERRGMKT